MHGRLGTAIEPHNVGMGEASGAIQIFVHPETVQPVVALGQDKDTIVRVSSAVEVVAAAVYGDSTDVSKSSEAGECQRTSSGKHNNGRGGQLTP